MNFNIKKVLWILGAIVLAIILVISVKFALDKLSNKDLVIQINSEEVILKKGNKDKINLKTLTNEKDIIIKQKSKTAKVYVNDKLVDKRNGLNIGKIRIHEDSKITVKVKYINGNVATYIINTLPTAFPAYDVQGESKFEGDYYTSTYSFQYDGAHYIFKIDKKGDIKFYKKTNMVAFDFRKEKNSKGDIRYMYLEATVTNWKNIKSILPCDLVLLDEKYNEIERVKYLNKDGTKKSLDNHTYVYLDDNHYILTSYEFRKKEVNGKMICVSDCVIEEIKDGKILWEFDSGNYPKFYKASSKEELDYSIPYQDYIHINSIAIDESDGNILCSFRNIDAILKISRKDGKLIWTLGGQADEFGLTKKQKFSKQHSIIYTGNNTIMLYDNGNANQRSRVVKIKLDEKNKKIVSYKDYDLDAYAPMMGSVRVLDEKTETYLVCYGGGSSPYKQHNIEEINFSTKGVSFKFTFLFPKMMYNVNKME